jgi:hypothetical protein
MRRRKGIYDRRECRLFSKSVGDGMKEEKQRRHSTLTFTVLSTLSTSTFNSNDILIKHNHGARTYGTYYLP